MVIGGKTTTARPNMEDRLAVIEDAVRSFGPVHLFAQTVRYDHQEDRLSAVLTLPLDAQMSSAFCHRELHTGRVAHRPAANPPRVKIERRRALSSTQIVPVLAEK
jgi:hypothetical protein